MTVKRIASFLHNRLSPLVNQLRYQHASMIRHPCSSDVNRETINKTGIIHPTLPFNDIPKMRNLTKMDEVVNVTPELSKKLAVIKLEYDVWEQSGIKLPLDMTHEMWEDVLQCPTMSSRRRLYKYLYSIEVKNRSKVKKSQMALDEQERNTPSHLPPRNTFYFYIRRQTMNVVQNSRIAQAMTFELPLVFDLNYERYMQYREKINVVKQILQSHGKNQESLTPFHFLLTDARPGELMDAFHRSKIEPLEEHMFTITQKSYLDVYPREQLVYLTPDATDIMRQFDHDKVYIVGGFVDKSTPQPLSMARAKEQGIAMQKLPLDHFLRWGCGSKSLTVDQVVCILLEMKASGNWEKAMLNVPIRKLVRDDKPDSHRYNRSSIAPRYNTFRY